MKRIVTIFMVLATQMAWAGDKYPYQNWTAELSGRDNEAYTIADANTSFGTFCAGEQCLFYLHQGLNCAPGAKYSVLMNSPSISTALTMECTLINGNIFQILTPFNAVLKATQVGESIGFAVALQSGAFAVSQFSLAGAKPAIERVLNEAANSKKREQQVQPPQILIIPPIQIVPNSPPNQAPNTPKNTPQKPGSKDISI
ncbi:hypothetical protein [Polynucleobacter sp. MWH-Adler-W8]|uniref:hypothetical protein n=1 Tax=Polynucleobacter sp. MWH-Adler-W8 TaxID=1819727 RepID=UPI0009276E37|nr:hypothetical protein [Polynucleobacter sp. MWH-Adler-W8]OJI05959.1 hypothetical protein AOC28_03340 [Polynucleobacter sp. MWH-Adler-W8]